MKTVAYFSARLTGSNSSPTIVNADVAKWKTQLAQTQLEQSVPVQIRSSVSVDLAQLVQHRPRNPAGEVIRHEGSTPSIHALCRHGGTGIHTCPRSKRESMWVRIPLTALRRFGRVDDCGSLENCRPGDPAPGFESQILRLHKKNEYGRVGEWFIPPHC